VRRGRPRHDDILTPREWQVLDLLRQGLTNEQIAVRLSISANTVKFHVSEILGKLGLSTREQAAAWRPPRRQWKATALATPFAAGAKAATALLGAVAIASGLIVLALALTRDGGDPFAAGPLGKIAYVQDGDIWVKALPDGKPARLTSDGNNAMPQWSPSGEWVLYRHGAVGPGLEAWVMRADGKDKRRISQDIAVLGTSWLQDTDRLLVWRDDRPLFEDADGGNAVAAPSPPYAGSGTNEETLGPFPSPDGRWIAYTLARRPAGTSEPPPGRWSYMGLWIARPDGGEARELFNLGENADTRIVPYGWSPDGTSVLFSFSHIEAGRTFLDGAPLYTVSIDGGESRDAGAVVVPVGAVAATSPVTGLQAIVEGGGQESWTNKRIALLDAQTTGITHLTDAATASNSPAWSRDGKSIAYISAPDFGPAGRDGALRVRRVWLMDADGSNKRPLTEGEGFRDEAPQWSRDGSRILFARLTTEPCDSSEYDLLLLNVATGAVEPVLTSLPLFGTENERLVVGEVPNCRHEDDSGWTTDSFGRLNLGLVLSWWQQAR
jgi:Tol biopolymer transport system component/DNA-binding CsgD family transcriptional regulator